jgi:hypothetical protein
LATALIRHPHHDPNTLSVKRIENGGQLSGTLIGLELV